MYALVLGSPGPSPGRRLACRRVLRLRGHGDTFDHLPDGGLLISDGDEEMRSTGEGEGVKSLDEVMLTRTEREQVKYWKKFEEAMVTELNEKNSTPFPVEKLFVSSNTTDTTWRAMELMKDCTTNAVQGNAEMSDGYLVFEHVFAVGEEIGLSFFHQFLRFVIALARDGKAETADGERVFDFITQQGIQPTEETYILMMNVICEGAKQKPQRGYLSEAYRWYEKSRKEGFESTQTIKEAYYEVYEAQSPNVYDIDLYRDNWCVLNSAEECLWQGFPEFGIEPHGSCTGLIPEEDLFNSTIQDMFKRDDNESSSDFNFTESETTSSSF
eukprot:440798-Hanusia_phi.AAC.5